MILTITAIGVIMGGGQSSTQKPVESGIHIKKVTFADNKENKTNTVIKRQVQRDNVVNPINNIVKTRDNVVHPINNTVKTERPQRNDVNTVCRTHFEWHYLYIYMICQWNKMLQKTSMSAGLTITHFEIVGSYICPFSNGIKNSHANN